MVSASALQAAEEPVDDGVESDDDDNGRNDDDNIATPPPPPSDLEPDFSGKLTSFDLEEDKHLASSPLPAVVDSQGVVIDRFPGAAVAFEGRETFISWFDLDLYSVYHKNNLYYPFADLEEWKMAKFLLMSWLSMNTIDEFLSYRWWVLCFHPNLQVLH